MTSRVSLLIQCLCPRKPGIQSAAVPWHPPHFDTWKLDARVVKLKRGLLADVELLKGRHINTVSSSMSILENSALNRTALGSTLRSVRYLQL
jgi:hypothetical protein